MYLTSINIIEKLRHVYRPLICMSLFVCFLLSGCNRPNQSRSISDSDDTMHITASFYPIYIMLMNITQNVEGVTLSLLAPSDTGCLHDYQLTTRDMRAIEQSDILVLNGGGMESFLDKAQQLRATSRTAISVENDGIIVASTDISLIDDNAHVWVSIPNAATQVTYIAESLALLDPPRSVLYRANAAQYVEKLLHVSEELSTTLEPYAGRHIITFHEAFPYFAHDYGLSLVASVEREPGTEPTARELQETIALIRSAVNSGVEPLLCAEVDYSSSAAKIIAQETGLPIYELDPAVTGELDADAYINAMRNNMHVLDEAFQRRYHE